MNKTKSIGLWMLALVIMASIAVYQRITGPTYPIGGKVEFAGSDINYRFPRSEGGSENLPIKVVVKDREIEGQLRYRRFKSHDEWSQVPMNRHGDTISAEIPGQPPAGKVQYQVMLQKNDQSIKMTDEPVIIRFKGHVPDYFLIPHILFMFTAMWFSMRTGFEALFKGNKTKILTIWTVILFAIGGMILGPVIQLYAFGDLWTGWPFGHDLTDNKTLVAFIFWLIALWRVHKNPENRFWPILASIMLLIVYLIPHSVLGSEIDFRQLEQNQM